MRQHLGQHFLKNKEKIREIIKTLEIKDGDTIVEIGPGHGELTLPLARKSQIIPMAKPSRTLDKVGANYKLQIIAIEKDAKLAECLRIKIKDLKFNNVEILNDDVLKILSKITTHYLLPTTHYKIVGNVPYYITGRLLRILSEIKPKPKLCVFTLQKEVAERICAMPKIHPVRGRPAEGTATTALGRSASNGMNLLAASVQFWADPEIVDIISKKDFKPRPKVDSAIIKLKTKDFDEESQENYYRLIKILFKQPRKTILNNLIAFDKSRRSYYKALLEKNGINPDDRPQNLSSKTIQKLAKMLYN